MIRGNLGASLCLEVLCSLHTQPSYGSDSCVKLAPDLEAQLVGKEISFLVSDLEKWFFPFLI